MPRDRTQAWACPVCGHEVVAIASAVAHKCPKKQGANGLSGALVNYRLNESEQQ